VQGWLPLLWDWPRRGRPELALNRILYALKAWLPGWYLSSGLVLWGGPRAPASRLPESSLKGIHVVRLGIQRALRQPGRDTLVPEL
jgi:hypothetical protein